MVERLAKVVNLLIQGTPEIGNLGLVVESLLEVVNSVVFPVLANLKLVLHVDI